jgi:hypothetical protein
MDCFNCGNCKNNEAMYYCTAKDEFVISSEPKVIEKMKASSTWKKGNSQYEDRRRRVRQLDVKDTG